jgi:hypothetical protein
MNDLNPVINVGTNKNPLMALCATTMMMMYEKSTGRKFDCDNMDDYLSYCDGYREAYNANLSNRIKLTKVAN